MSKDIPSGTVGERSLDTPEHNLWVAVLRLFLSDALRARGTGEEKYFRRMAKSYWHRFICDLIEIDHTYYVEEIEKALGLRP